MLAQAVAFLAGDWSGGAPLDLSTVMVVVPTRQSGRRLREAIAAHAAAQGQAAFPPRVVSPDRLIALDATAGIASRLESLLAWAAVFRSIALDDFRRVFPMDPPARNFPWALRLAQEFVRLQGTLAEAGLRLGDIPARAGENFAEAERWHQIAALEALQAERLAELGLSDGQAAKIARAAAPVRPAEVQRIIVLGTPDPLPLVLQALEAHAREIAVEVVVFAPEEEKTSFDLWGRPIAAAWTQRIFDLPEFERRVHLLADPAAQAMRVVAMAADYGDPEGLLGVGVADPEVLPLLETGLRRAGIAGFNPEGRIRHGDRLFQLLTALSEVTRDDAFAACEALARCPDFLEFLRARRPDFSAATFLARLDDLHARYLPPDLAEARRHAPQDADLAAIVELRATLTTGSFPANAGQALDAIFSGRRFDLTQPADAEVAEAAETWAEVMRACQAAAERFRGIDTAEWWDVALRLYSETTRTDEKPAGALELQGWLELLWEDAPHLAVAGLNDGSVPDAVVGDPFLPESLRERLGLKTNAARFARDAYLLQALAASRRDGGRLDLLFGKNSLAGDPLRPSRLLLRCADSDLPGRIAFLFRSAEAERASPPWRRAWRLQPPAAPVPERLAVTALAQWLACPFRFFLGRVLRWEAVDPEKMELDALDFGTLCHAALEKMGQNQMLRNCTDGKQLREFLLAELEREAGVRFGRELTLPLVIQLESARQRLTRAAEVQAQTRGEGWVIQEVEFPFFLEVAGLKVSGKIDRIDRHEGTGAIRILDYKTSDQPVQPAEAHLRLLRRGEEVPDFAKFEDEGRARVWQNLQLPLYGRALAGQFPGEASLGYFNLPKAATETGIALWADYTPDVAEAAWRCATGVAAAIRAGEFWPPNEDIRPEQDEFAALFHHGVAASVAWKEEVKT